MSSANRKEQRVSFQTIPSSKSHRHQTSDSGVGSDFSSSPTPQEYFDLERNHIKLKEEFLATRNKLKEAEAQLQEANARLSAMENTVEVLKNDNKALDREKRNLRTEVEALRDDIRKSRSSPPRESTKMSGALPPHPSSPKEHKEHKEHKSSRRSESKHHRSESKHRRSESKPRKNTEEKELEKRVKQDKERLRGRFDHKDDKSIASSTSSGRSKQSGSYMEPLGPVAPRPAPAVEQAGRSRHSHHNSIRPAVYTTTTIPEPAYGALPHSPAYQDYDADYYPDATSQYVQEDGGYHFHPLPVDPPRGRSHR
ncbi:hypothetical protein CH63R_10308 [Colletotrichum higginsianum IMI 349063]|uniref:Uncharacterized protein n=4 Tax=Colletotrichum higginsianum TaxID=80884 RepID=A0A1B7Y2E1_COLHI|nr:uncharacterized protein CH63R_10308 [Colletotrichum higginsianum IMI 349063]OBR06188.1 hypothetical protein CH63R_10308 [Colletotrichum higginsianum IMI 349063]TIC97388.1 hypothetical protein CH35J_007143 [Colletotrichum higginsianum]